MRRARIPIVLYLVLVLGLVFGCGDDNGTEPETEPPVINGLTADFPVVQAGDTVVVRCSATDPEGEDLTYSWLCSAGTIAGDDTTAVWTAPDAGILCTITVTATDPAGGKASETVSIQAVAGTLLAQTRDGLIAADFTGGSFLLNELNTKVEVLDTRIFQMASHRIHEIDYLGQIINTVNISDPDVGGYNFFMLPDAGFVFISNGPDSTYFMDATGSLEFRGVLPETSPGSLQEVYGRVVGDRLIVSETGTYKIAAIDLATHEGTILKELPGRGWLGSLAYHDGVFYVAGSTLIRKFTETGDPEDLCVSDEGNWRGLTWAGGYLWGVINFEGTLCRIDPNTGEIVTILEGLDYPGDLEFLPVVLEEPAQP